MFGNKAQGHAKASDYLASLGARDFDRFYKFSVIRNPFDRFSSAYFYLRKGGMDEGDRAFTESFLAKYKDIREFALHGLEAASTQQVHFHPQCSFLIDPRSNGLCTDALIRFEEMTEGFENVRARLGITATLPALNPTGDKPEWRRLLCEDAIDAILRVYREDYDRLGYSCHTP